MDLLDVGAINVGKYKIFLVFFCTIILLAIFSLAGFGNTYDDTEAKSEYGVFIGLDPENTETLLDYNLVVIDAAYYSEDEIEKLHNNGIKVYSYLNVGSLETFRDYYATYEHLILGKYENWEGEYWINVFHPQWKNHIIEEAGALVGKGVDGFFLDNTDVYYHFHNREIFQGLITILKGLEQYRKDILVNGGDIFVTEAILDADSPMIKITGVNQECVFTNIDFNSNLLTGQDLDTSMYYQTYLEQCAEAGLSVYLTEYAEKSNGVLWKRIDGYCKQHQYVYFISPSINLDTDGNIVQN